MVDKYEELIEMLSPEVAKGPDWLQVMVPLICQMMIELHTIRTEIQDARKELAQANEPDPDDDPDMFATLNGPRTTP